jgi:hypothetical protein
MNRMQEALMRKPGYTPYCGADACMVWARTRWNGEQFQCQCGWISSYAPEFIAQYKARWHPEPKP